MLQLFIDGQVADIDQRTDLSVSLSIASLSSTQWGRASYSKSITIPQTPNNRALMGDCEQPHAAHIFNHTLHTARVEWEGSVIIEGVVMLTACVLGEGGYYRFNIIGPAKEWVRAASSSLRSLPVDYHATLDSPTVFHSWHDWDEALVRYLPVERGRKMEGNPSHQVRRICLDDYHPMLHLRSLLDAIFAQSGYKVSSSFLSSEFFSSLYISGRWSERSVESAAVAMNFKAVRSAASDTVEANEFGRVYADHLANYHTVGNLVDGVVDVESGNSSEAFHLDHTGRICFTAESAVAVAFEYHLRYLTDTRIISRTQLVCFNEIRPAFGDLITFEPTNPYVDRKGEDFVSGRLYTLAIFGATEGATYTLEATVDGVDGVVVATTTQPFSTVKCDAARVVNLRLRKQSGVLTVDATEDWALYDGYVRECGSRQVEVTVRSAPKRLSAGESQYFDMFYFGGAEEGMTMQLLEGTWMRPLFVTTPIEGESVGWADVADYSFSQLDLIAAVKNLFDLQIYTDTSTKRVYIEPHSTFCNGEVVVDWSDKVDFGHGVQVEELGANGMSALAVAYRHTDKASALLSESEGVPYGEWSAPIYNRFATQGVERNENPLFAPSVSVVGSVPTAPSVGLIAVGDRDAEDDGVRLRSSFDTKIVAYRSMQHLSEGEQWAWPPEHTGKIPLLEFFTPDGDAPLSLLFENREGVVGLGGEYWQKRVDALNNAKRITLHLHLSPDEVEAIAFPNSTGHDFRALYRLRLEGEEVLCRLEEVCDYNPLAPSTKCVFVTNV